ncbi:MAG: hypothetical protein HY892_19165, partial [Deltaproteobacteria bacterium]|nr:hypothetical protein [Deltaproteobacteria bacterium]
MKTRYSGKIEERNAMKTSLLVKLLIIRSLIVILCVQLGLPWYAATPALAQTVTRTPNVPMELPVEVEIELAPAASLKQAPLWKELIQLLRFPDAHIPDPLVYPPATLADPNARLTAAPIVRRLSFTANPLPPLKIWSPGYNFLTAQPLRLRTNDGEVSWDQPGPLFDNNEVVPVNQFNVPTAVRTPIGHLVACPDPAPPNNYQSATLPGGFCDAAPAGSLVVFNPGGSPLIPPTGTVVAVSAYVAGVLQELDGTSTTATTAVATPLEIPVNEEDFFRPTTDTAGVPAALVSYIGRRGAEVLGKALFWDMQVGSDGIQACGSCHFSAGADNRTRNQRNPNINGPLGNAATLEALSVSATTLFNSDVVAGDFPFHKRVDPNVAGDGLAPGIAASDANDVMSSMGVSRFKQFVDIPPIGGIGASFGSLNNGVRPLLPDIGNIVPDPVPVNEGFRRVEPRNTPTFHGAAFNLDNFWDGRARFHFNGGSVFGPSDPTAHIFISNGNAIVGALNGLVRPDLDPADAQFDQPVRIKFSSLASQAVGPPLSDFEMSFSGRNWPKIGKKLLQPSSFQQTGFGAPVQNGQLWQTTPLANQLVSPTDSVLGPFSGQRSTVGGAVNRPGRPGLNISYPALIRLAFTSNFWRNTGIGGNHLNGCFTDGRTPACPGTIAPDPFDGYVLTIANGPANPTNTNQFTQMEANFSLFFGLAVQAYEQLVIPDDTPFDRFMDANPLAANAIGQPGEQAVLFPTLIPTLVGGGVTLVPGFGPEEILGFDIFAGGNLTAALPAGPVGVPGGPGNRNPTFQITRDNGTPLNISVGSNPFTRSARCMLCHLGPEQTDHSINISHGLLKGDAEFEMPTPPFVTDPGSPNNCVFTIAPDTCFLPGPEPPGVLRTVPGLVLSEEIAGTPQDAVEVEPRNFATFDNPATPWDDRVVAQPAFFAFGDQGIYNVGVRPIQEDIGRGGNDPFAMPLSLSALALKNIGQPGFEPCDLPTDSCVMTNFDPLNPGLTFEESGGGFAFPGTTLGLQSINPGFEKDPAIPTLPPYLAPWTNGLPAGELHPQIDEMAFGPNTITPPTGGPALEFAEAMFGADVHCGLYDPAQFGSGPPNFGWGPPTSTDRVCPNNQSATGGNYDAVLHGTWPVPNRVLRNGAFKAPSLRNVELTGPYFHTGSYLTLRQVVDFYMRGGDFPLTNAEARDPHVLDIEEQAFGFGRVTGADLGIIDLNVLVPGAFTPTGTFLGNIADALPDTAFLYDAMPDTNHPLTPEYLTPEEAKVALVKFLLSLTDDRVRFERAPFDRPEIFVPIDGLAPENTGGRAVLLANSVEFITATPPAGNTRKFRHLPEVGAAGNANPVPAFLGVTNNPLANCTTEISHFCSAVNPVNLNSAVNRVNLNETTLRKRTGDPKSLKGIPSR